MATIFFNAEASKFHLHIPTITVRFFSTRILKLLVLSCQQLASSTYSYRHVCFISLSSSCLLDFILHNFPEPLSPANLEACGAIKKRYNDLDQITKIVTTKFLLSSGHIYLERSVGD